MLMTMEPEIQRNLKPLHVHEMLRELKTLFAHMGKIVNELHVMLKLHEQTLPKNNALALHAIRAVFSQVVEEEKERSFGSWWFRKLKPGALSLYVGNGQREAVEAIGAFHLCLPSGLEIVLNNCHYAPSITIGVISVSRLYEDGFINRFVNNTIQHCRLGHISKKRIKKLQHDGLLDSSDLKAFEKCVSCMSGKMARKPYTHQVERAKDLLGLIHTDIISHRTPPYTPQYIGVSKRRNRTLLDMVRSMMSQTTLPKSFWDYALETAARILNMVPTKKVEKTPYEVWHRQAPKLSYLKVWGCEALVKRDTLTKPDKLEPRYIKCIDIC
nr:retrovirus-related Pol polyprotein from transposon TNT 1-94 [Tanacetum cinerariifolium]